MPKPPLELETSVLEASIIETLRAGLHQWRSDLDYPASWSDWQACVRGLLVMFEVKRRPLPQPLASPCPKCEGLGHPTRLENGVRYLTTCPQCNDTGKVYY